MIEIRRIETVADWQAARQIRQRVFIEEQKCPPEDEWDEHDWPSETCVHLLGAVRSTPVATARWRPVGDGDAAAAKLERFAVLLEFRGRGYGKGMVAATIEDARRNGHSHFVMHAQTYLVPFYSGFGFEAAGDEFMEAGIAHVVMTLADDRPLGKSLRER